MTARDLIKGSLRLIGAIASGETPQANESADALARLNSMIKSWNIEGLMVFKVTREEFALVSAAASRTMGPSTGNFLTSRPNRILNAAVEVNGIETPIDIVTAEQWAQISDKSASGLPSKIYVEGTYPLETINFWPIPNSTDNIVIYSQKPIASALALSDVLAVPDGYEEALEYNLAVRLAPEYGRPLDQLVFVTAQELKAQIKKQNTKPAFMVSDAAGLTGRGSSFNINTGE